MIIEPWIVQSLYGHLLLDRRQGDWQRKDARDRQQIDAARRWLAYHLHFAMLVMERWLSRSK